MERDKDVLDLEKFLDTCEFRKFIKTVGLSCIRSFKEGELVKFRRWETSWPLPEECEVRDEIIKYGRSRRNQSIIKRTVWARIEILERFQERWLRDSPPKYWGNQAKIPYEIKNGWIWCKIHDNWIYETREFNFLLKKGWLFLEIPKRGLGDFIHI